MSTDTACAISLFALGLLFEIMYLTTDSFSWIGATILIALCWMTAYVYLKYE